MLICVLMLVKCNTAASMTLLLLQEVVKNGVVVHQHAVCQRETCHFRSIEVRSLAVVVSSEMS